MTTKKIQKAVEQVTAKEGLQAGHRYLLSMRDDLKKQLEVVEEMIRAIENEAVDQKLGMLVPGTPRELAPTKETFIKAFGIDVWERMKRLSKASPRFVWKDDCTM